MNYFDQPPNIETRTYEKIRFAAQMAMEREMLDAKFDIAEHAGFMADQLVMRVKADIWAYQDKEEDVEYAAVPLTWWDFAKDTFAVWAYSKKWERLGDRVAKNLEYRYIAIERKHWHVYPNLKFESPCEQVRIPHLKEE